MPHCHWLTLSRELRTWQGQGWSLCFWCWTALGLTSCWILKTNHVVSLCWMLTGKHFLIHRMSQSSFLPQTGPEQGLAHGKDVWNYFLQSLRALVPRRWRNGLGKCCSILIAALTLGQLGAPDALISRPYQDFSVKITFLIENVLSMKRKPVFGLKSFLSVSLKYSFLFNWLNFSNQFQFYQQHKLWISKNIIFLEVLSYEKCCGFQFSSKSWINFFSKTRKYVMSRDFHFLASHDFSGIIIISSFHSFYVEPFINTLDHSKEYTQVIF